MRISLGILLLIPTLAGAQLRPAFKPRAHETPVIRLLEPGAAPLAVLRYAFPANQTQNVTITATGAMDVTKDGTQRTFPMPTLTMPVSLAPGKKGVVYRWLKGTFTTSPEDLQTAHIMSALEGSSGTMVMAEDQRGVITNMLLAAGPNDKGAAQGKLENRSLIAMEMGKGVLSLLEVPLPVEPIGVGGRWQVERIAVRGIVSIRQFTTFTLVARQGNRLELSYRVGGDWDPGSGLKREELRLAVSGSGTCVLDLTRPMPTVLTDDVVVKTTVTALDGTQTFQTTRVGTTVESK